MENGDTKRLDQLISDVDQLKTAVTEAQGRLTRLETTVTDVQGNLERLIVDFKESLEREMRTGFADVKAEIGHMKSRLETDEARLERQGGILQSGGRWSARMTECSEKVDTTLARQDREIAAMDERVRRLDERLGH